MGYSIKLVHEPRQMNLERGRAIFFCVQFFLKLCKKVINRAVEVVGVIAIDMDRRFR